MIMRVVECNCQYYKDIPFARAASGVSGKGGTLVK